MNKLEKEATECLNQLKDENDELIKEAKEMISDVTNKAIVWVRKNAKLNAENLILEAKLAQLNEQNNDICRQMQEPCHSQYKVNLKHNGLVNLEKENDAKDNLNHLVNVKVKKEDESEGNSHVVPSNRSSNFSLNINLDSESQSVIKSDD